ncbi:uncharacterized protein DS421_7g214410 [Arachis hypogaea]|nr:uncharacterized protein DS421_7g214410 [Arachis hypogaea]
MKEIIRGYPVAVEARPPLLELDVVALLPPSGCCAAAEELESKKEGCLTAVVLCRRVAIDWSSWLSYCIVSKPLRCRKC